MKRLTFLFMLLITNGLLAQNEITGTVVDEASLPLPGANVSLVGTDTGATTDFDGKFTIETDQVTGKVKISYVGFQAKTISFNLKGETSVDLGNIILTNDENSLGELLIVGKGVIDLEKDRKTPIAVSTVTRREIQLRDAGNVEFPHILENTPNVYVSNESGGFGDSQMFVRGFDQRNT